MVKISKAKIAIYLGCIMALLSLYLLFWPIPIEPEAWIPPEPPILSGKYALNNRLASVQRLVEGVGIGPEAVTYDNKGSLYTGLPDNITSNGKGKFWLALLYGPEGRKSVDTLLPKPFLRKLLLRLPDLLKPEQKRIGYVLGLNLDGEVVHNLQDPKGDKYAEISSVIEHEGIRYLGSISENSIGSIAVPEPL
jgi:hypothetical protein